MAEKLTREIRLTLPIKYVQAYRKSGCKNWNDYVQNLIDKSMPLSEKEARRKIEDGILMMAKIAEQKAIKRQHDKKAEIHRELEKAGSEQSQGILLRLETQLRTATEAITRTETAEEAQMITKKYEDSIRHITDGGRNARLDF